MTLITNEEPKQETADCNREIENKTISFET